MGSGGQDPPPSFLLPPSSSPLPVVDERAAKVHQGGGASTVYPPMGHRASLPFAACRPRTLERWRGRTMRFLYYLLPAALFQRKAHAHVRSSSLLPLSPVLVATIDLGRVVSFLFSFFFFWFGLLWTTSAVPGLKQESDACMREEILRLDMLSPKLNANAVALAYMLTLLRQEIHLYRRKPGRRKRRTDKGST